LGLGVKQSVSTGIARERGRQREHESENVLHPPS
jgi:hypothetical protein